MSRHERNWLSRRIRAQSSRQWARMLRALTRRSGPADPDLRDEARNLHQILSRFLQANDARQPRGRNSLARLDLPAGTDWSWRPEVLRARAMGPALIAPKGDQWLSDQVALFHDCPRRALILRQIRNHRATDLSEYGLEMEVMGFEGTFLSFSLTLPPEALDKLSGHHVLRLDSTLQAERPIAVYARLNVQQGPNTETILRQMGHPIDGGHCERTVEFDLGYAELSPRSVDKVWLDLIFEAPFMNAVALRDVILSRHTRAQM